MDEFKSQTGAGETNRGGSEFKFNAENSLPGENTVISENKVASENTEVGANPQKKEATRNRRSNAVAGLTTSLVGAISVAAFGITTLLNVSMSASFNTVTYEAGTISYAVSVTDKTDKETLTLYFDDPLTGETTPIDLTSAQPDDDGEIKGTIDIDAQTAYEKCQAGLEESLKFRLTLKGVVGLGVERSFDSYVVNFKTMVSEIREVSGECHCGEDGYFHFRVDFQDDLGKFSNFYSYIEDENQKRSYCEFSENLHDDQYIYVNDLTGSTCTWVFTCDVAGESSPHVLYNGEIHL